MTSLRLLLFFSIVLFISHPHVYAQTEEPADTLEVAEAPDSSNIHENSSEVQDLISRVEKLEKDTIWKYTLDPDSVFFGFSTGATFDFIEGLNDATIYLDLTANLGQVLGKRWTSEFGVKSGRFAPNVSERQTERTILTGSELVTDSTTRLFTARITSNQIETTQMRFTRAFAKVNMRIGKVDNGFKNSKLYWTSLFNYNRVEFDVSNSQQIVVNDTSSSVVPRRVNINASNPLATDTLNTKIIQDRSSVFTGIRLFKSYKNFDFDIAGHLGYNWINEVSLTSDTPTTISTSSSFAYVFQAAILEKRTIGAKIGFELRDKFRDNVETPQYYFFISKQFSITEFFKVFSPTSG